MQPNNKVVILGTNISVAYNNRHTFVTHTIGPCISALALLLVCRSGAEAEGTAPIWDHAGLTEDRREDLGRKRLEQTIPQSDGEIIFSWERRSHGEENKSMNSNSN